MSCADPNFVKHCWGDGRLAGRQNKKEGVKMREKKKKLPQYPTPDYYRACYDNFNNRHTWILSPCTGWSVDEQSAAEQKRSPGKKLVNM